MTSLYESPRLLAALPFVLVACGGPDDVALAQGHPFEIMVIADFDEPWAMAFLPDERLLVSEKHGALKLFDPRGETFDIGGVPAVENAGQGGFGDVVLHPEFAANQLVYVSYAEPGNGDTAGAAVARAKLELDGGSGRLADLEVIWRQSPKVGGRGHYGHRIAFDDDGYLWISSGERQQFDPAQQMDKNLGKVLRLNDDGSVPADNPFAGETGVTAQIWSLGHRNPLGLAFDGNGRLWELEMGPDGGDELNLVQRAANYGYPLVSNGGHYDGRDIPNHKEGDGFNAPAVFWNPVISPSSLMFYSGSEFPEWQGDAFIGGLSSEALVRIEFDGDSAREAERFDMDARIRAVAQGPDGAIWVLEDEDNGSQGRLLRLGRTE